jgi:hypothetical protein
MNEQIFGRVGAKPHRHRKPIHEILMPDGSSERHYACHHPVDEAKARQGKTVRNYGNRAELAVAREYGGRKVGHAQGPTDVVGKTTKTQLKTTRRPAPLMWSREFAKLESERDGRLPRLLLRFVRPGNAPDDYFVVRGSDWLEYIGRDD